MARLGAACAADMDDEMTITMTILWITMLGGPLDGDTFGIPYMTPEACEAAMRPVGDTLDYDWKMQCETLTVTKEMEP